MKKLQTPQNLRGKNQKTNRQKNFEIISKRFKNKLKKISTSLLAMFMWRMLTCIYICVCVCLVYTMQMYGCVCMLANLKQFFLGKVFWEFSFIALSQLGRFRSIPVTDVFLQTNSKRFSLIEQKKN